MEPERGLALSARKVDYLKFILKTGGTVRTNEIASAFSVDPSTITKTLAEIAAAGYITHTPYHGVSLTDFGKHHAEFLVKRHRILSLMLARNGLPPQEACHEAARFESHVSKKAIDRICHFMGHPRQGVCGEIMHDDGCLIENQKNRNPS
ncbi:MAG: metal-dependent transcriptional regulator [Methanomicrobiales archaeon HGW-Methanomicrobiales-1]|jgi:Mn-dependent DtxR family transcriptional regulator|nr:MAG: metal-dependent transcriptional regulator [Methanomicrobiales archaeon HGW-Methanomicrobiales-1]